MSSPAVPLERSQAQSHLAASSASTAGRLFFIDNIRVLLTVLVILHHLMVIYAGSGSWIYLEGRQDDITSALGGWFCAVNQAYFMGLFLLISAYFVPGSYDRKGPGNFLKDRFLRLGIPLLVYAWVVRPVVMYFGFAAAGGLRQGFLDWLMGTYFKDAGIVGGGPLWFIETLLIFSVVYVLWRLLTRSRPRAAAQPAGFPSLGAIAVCAVLLGVATFAVRVKFPVGASFKPLNLQLANFVQYIVLFVLGLIGYRRNWFLALPRMTGRVALGLSAALIIFYPVLAVLAGATVDKAPFMGGRHWQSLLYATWEGFMCLSMSIGVLYLFRERSNRPTRSTRLLSRTAYTAYLIHEPVITLLAVAVADLTLYPLLKFALASLVFVPLTFGLSMLVLKIPGANRIL